MSDKEKQEQAIAQEIEELKQQIATLSTERDNVVGELKEDRTKRQELETEIENLRADLANAVKANTPAPENGDDIINKVGQLIEQKFGEKEASIAKGNKQAAIDRFVNEHKDFHEENDTTGKRREALMNAVKRFNTDGLTTEAEFYAVVKDAARLLGTDTEPTNPAEKPDIPSGPSPSSTPKSVVQGEFSEKERKLLERNGMSAERFKSLKERNPNYIEQLLQYID